MLQFVCHIISVVILHIPVIDHKKNVFFFLAERNKHLAPIVANHPGMARTVPEFGPMSQLCCGLPDLIAMSQNPALLHKWGCGSNIFSGRGSQNLGGVAQIVGVATQSERGPKIFTCALRAFFTMS